jgi:DNA-binding response OmpR family regulator
LSKPFSPRELLARLRAVLRRAQGDIESEQLSSGGVVVDLAERRVSLDGAPIELTGLEFDLLVVLMRRAGRVVPRTQLLDLAGRGDVSVGERTVDVHISHLRKKLGDERAEPALIKTVRGIGYVFTRNGK